MSVKKHKNSCKVPQEESGGQRMVVILPILLIPKANNADRLASDTPVIMVAAHRKKRLSVRVPYQAPQ